ncbi:WhiB family transcriptional regulator [Streptomyces sp. NPDC001685]
MPAPRTPRPGLPHLRGNQPPAHTFQARTPNSRSEWSTRTPPAGKQPDLPVDTIPTTPLKKKTTAAKALCTRCPLSDACTDHAIANEPSRSSSRAA